MYESNELLAEIPLEGYLTDQITSDQEYDINNRLFIIAQSYFDDPRTFGFTYGVIYEGLQKQLSATTTVFDRLFNFAGSAITVKKGPFRLLHSLEDIHRAVRANNPGISEFSYYTSTYFILSHIAVKNKIDRKKLDKISTFEIDMNQCSCKRYFDIILTVSPFLHRKASFFKHYASDIYSTLHHYCSNVLTKYYK